MRDYGIIFPVSLLSLNFLPSLPYTFPMIPIKARLATAEDLDVCVELDGTDTTAPRTDGEKRIFMMGKILSQDIFLAEDDRQQVVGYLRIDKLWSMMLPLVSWIYVRPEARDQSVTLQLRTFALNHLRAHGYKQLLYSTQTDRPHIIQWFLGMGLREVGSLSINPGIDAEEVFFIQDL